MERTSAGAELDFESIKAKCAVQVPETSDLLDFNNLRDRIACNMLNGLPYVKMRMDMAKLGQCLEGCVGMVLESIKQQGNLDGFNGFAFGSQIKSFYVDQAWFKQTYSHSPAYPLDLNREIRSEVLKQLDRIFNQAVLTLLALCLAGITGYEGLVGIIYMKIGELAAQNLII